MTIPDELIQKLNEAVSESFVVDSMFQSPLTLCSGLFIEASALCYLTAAGKPTKEQALHVAALALRLITDYE